jgi:hypothetical protein
MTETAKLYRVIREHEGERFYRPGEERVARPTSVAHLVPPCLEEIGDAPDQAKSEEAPLNKAEPAAPANKASGRKANKKG